MTTTTDRLRSFWGERQFDRERATSLAARYWYVALVVAVVAFAAGMRLWDLGGRAIHHDESIHVLFAYNVAQDGLNAYTHDPVYHGPFQYYGTAFTFLLFGDSDYTSRLFPALFGIALVGLPFLLRRQLGMIGAFAAAGLLAVSPVLTYFSRFARNDIYAAFFTLGIVAAIWRYLEDRREGWLIAIAPMLALSFAAKEVTFIIAAVLLLYLNFHIARDLVQQIEASRRLEPGDRVLAYAALLPTAWLIVAIWPLIGGVRRRFSLHEMPAAGPLLIVLGTLAGPQFSAGMQLVTGDEGYLEEGNLIKGTALVLIILSAYVGLMWNWRVWLLAAAAFYIPYVILFTSFFTNMGGFWSGVWGSMDYWLGQQDVRRGNQPDYYYFMLLPVYEFLAVAFAVGGTLYYGFRGKMEQKLLAAGALLLVILFSVLPAGMQPFNTFHIWVAFFIAIGAVLLLSMEAFTKFLLLWLLAVLLGLTVAGEKMPWLTVHLALPLALLAAKVLDDVLSRVRDTVAERTEEGATVPWERYLPFAYAALSALTAAVLFVSFGPASGVSLLAWLLALTAAASVVWAARSISLRAAGQTAVVALVAALLVFTVRAGANAAFDEGNPDGYARELLIYAQGSPKLDVIDEEIEGYAAATGQGKDVPIVIDNSGNIWPWPWYLRDYSKLRYEDFSGEVAIEEQVIVLVRASNRAQMEEYASSYQEPIPYRHMWWFPEHYRGLSTGGFLSDALTFNYFDTWRGYFIDRIVPGASETPDMLAYFPSGDFQVDVPVTPDGVPGRAASTLIPLEQRSEIGDALGSEPGQFQQPADIAVDEDGNVYLVDTLNHRIQRIARDGSVETVGESGGGDGEFGNPRSDEYQVDDGPWGMGIAPDGRVYVADTWNHRIQVFSSDLEYESDFGTGELFGPRDVDFDEDGNVLVVDTGNGRIAVFSDDGELQRAFGEKGDDPGEFNEPTSISVAPDTGDIYVADFWNKRIQHFDSGFNYIDEISVPTWGSNAINERAYIKALPNSRVLATDPSQGRIVLFNADGEEEGAWRVSRDQQATRPIGIAVESAGRLYVGDAFNSRLWMMPITVLTEGLSEEEPAQ